MSSAATAGGAAPRGPSIDGRPLEDRSAASTQAKLDRLHQDFIALELWAIENRDGNNFADQVAQYAAGRLAEWDQPIEEWEP